MLTLQVVLVLGHVKSAWSGAKKQNLPAGGAHRQKGTQEPNHFTFKGGAGV